MSCMKRCQQNMLTSFGSVGMPNLVMAQVSVNRLMAIQTTSKLLITLENILQLLVQQSKLMLIASCSIITSTLGRTTLVHHFYSSITLMLS